ncbi:MAG TPA: NAD-dependent succinate-semialdehyde dehydrogenase [Gemmatimonadaceae bacterium]|nr:NAD-dependent succinate-semialdehyde dehydrogenase [Gemmatimonadaceae bacterium]
MTIATINPATGETVKTFEPASERDVEQVLERAASAFKAHRRSLFAERCALMTRAAEILEEEKNDLGRLMTLEMGKPIDAAIAEAEKCASACRYYVEHAETFLADENVVVKDGRAWIAFQPIGPVLAIMPWNFPFWQVFRFAAPALMAGNVGILKHASNVPQCALAIADVFKRAGFEDGVFQTLLVESSAVADLIADPRIAAVTLTGSEGAGRSVAGTAGKHLKKTVIELGGSDPFIVMPSADVDAAAKTAVTARMINNGQSCIAAKRFIVHEQIYERFMERFVSGVRALHVGDPMDKKTQVGPLATAQIRDDLEKQVNATVAAGARVDVGGKRVDGRGFFFQPTILSEIPAGAAAESEELFGPVASVWKVGSIDEAIERANGTSFGLGASAWTEDAGEREQFVREIEAGLVFINGMVASEPALPFGGVKSSGYGRELSVFGIREFVNIKSVKISAGVQERKTE